MKIRFLKIRLSDLKYKALAVEADALGVPVSAYGRGILERHEEVVTQGKFLSALDARLNATPVSVAGAALTDLVN